MHSIEEYSDFLFGQYKLCNHLTNELKSNKKSIKIILKTLLEQMKQNSLIRFHVNTEDWWKDNQSQYKIKSDSFGINFSRLSISYNLEGKFCEYVLGNRFFQLYKSILPILNDLIVILKKEKIGIITINASPYQINSYLRIFSEKPILPLKTAISLSFHIDEITQFEARIDNSVKYLLTKISSENIDLTSERIQEFLETKVFESLNCSLVSKKEFVERLNALFYMETREKKPRTSLKYLIPADNPFIQIFGVGPRYTKILNNAGYHSLQELISDSNEIIWKRVEKKIGLKKINRIRTQVKTMFNKQVNFLSDLFPDVDILRNGIILDIETNYEHTEIWAISYLHKNEFTSFFLEIAGESKLEKQLLLDFLTSLKKLVKSEPLVLYCYSGSNFDFRVIKNRLLYHKISKRFYSKLEKNDLFFELQRSVIFPLPNYQLKTVGEFLDIPKKSPYNYDGLQASNDYYQVFSAHDSTMEEKYTLKEKLLLYNKEDCYLIFEIWDTLQKYKTQPDIIPMKDEKEIKLYFDGSVYSKEKRAGAGWIIKYTDTDGKEKQLQGSKMLYDKTSNEAEWIALLEGIKILEKIEEIDKSRLFIYGDSQLVIYQLIGKYRIHAEHLQIYYEDVKKRLGSIKWVAKWIPREFNDEADYLAGIASAEKS